MKNYIVIISFCSLLFASCSNLGEDSNIPSAVIAAFEAKFPNASHVEWERESTEEFEAEFIYQEQEYSACFLSSGAWTETEWVVEQGEYPTRIDLVAKSEFPNLNIEKVEAIESSQGMKYEIKLGDDVFKVSFKVDEEGNLIDRK